MILQRTDTGQKLTIENVNKEELREAVDYIYHKDFYIPLTERQLKIILASLREYRELFDLFAAEIKNEGYKESQSSTVELGDYNTSFTVVKSTPETIRLLEPSIGYIEFDNFHRLVTK